MSEGYREEREGCCTGVEVVKLPRLNDMAESIGAVCLLGSRVLLEMAVSHPSPSLALSKSSNSALPSKGKKQKLALVN